MFSASASRHVKSVQTGFRIIHVLQNHDGATLNELSEELDLAKSTVHNYLQTLESMGYVVNYDGTYRLGLRFLTHGMAAKSSPRTAALVEPVLEEVASEAEQAAWWIVEEFGRGIFLESDVPDGSKRIYGRVGKRSYLHTHAPGKAILAELPDEYLEQLIDHHGLPGHTAHTTVDADSLRDELGRVRERGYARSDGEAVLGVQSVGAAFRDPEGRTHAIGVFGYSHDIGDERFDDEIPAVIRSAADDLAASLEGEGDHQ